MPARRERSSVDVRAAQMTTSRALRAAESGPCAPRAASVRREPGRGRGHPREVGARARLRHRQRETGVAASPRR